MWASLIKWVNMWIVRKDVEQMKWADAVLMRRNKKHAKEFFAKSEFHVS